MPTYSGNNVYLKIDGTEVHKYWRSVSLGESIGTEDVTAGAGADHVQRAEKLRDHSISIVIVYDTEKLQDYIQLLRPGRHTIEVGSEGNVSGKPRHVQDFIITEQPLEISVEKNRVEFSVSGEAADAPTVNMYAGGKYA
jgi:hypothetical protein